MRKLVIGQFEFVSWFAKTAKLSHSTTPRVRTVDAFIEQPRGRRSRTYLARYGQTFKDRAVARLLPPQIAALEVVAREVGV